MSCRSARHLEHRGGVQRRSEIRDAGRFGGRAEVCILRAERGRRPQAAAEQVPVDEAQVALGGATAGVPVPAGSQADMSIALAVMCPSSPMLMFE